MSVNVNPALASSVSANLSLGEEHGIAVEQGQQGFLVKTPFDRQLHAMLERVAGATYTKEHQGFDVPSASQEALGAMLPALRKAAKSIADDLATIKALAQTSAVRRQEARANAPARPQISAYHEAGRAYIGEIINANANFVAQLTGFGNKDGAAFVTIHRTADLNARNIMKGDMLRIRYDNRMLGDVTPYERSKSPGELQEEFEAQLGKEISGVTLTDRGDSIGVGFAMNLALVERIRRVDGAAFNQLDKVWEIPKANLEYVLRAAQGMRDDYALDAKEAEMMAGIAENKIDGANVRAAFTKDGQRHSGPIVAVGDRLALQKTGRGDFTLHSLRALSERPQVNSNAEIEYHNGTGKVVDLDRVRAQNKAASVAR